MNLNPNHPTTRSLDGQWHKFAAMLMQKFGTDHVVLTALDVISFGGGRAITVQELDDGIHLRIVDERTADRLAREHGGLPT